MLFFERLTLLPLITSIRVFKDIRREEFIQFGFHRTTVPTFFHTSRFLIFSANWENVDIFNDFSTQKIVNFYEANDYNLEHSQIQNYFKPELNKWFVITGRKSRKTYGFIRAYNVAQVFTGGMCIELIIDKQLRNKGCATEALKGLLEFVQSYSYAFLVSAEVKTENLPAIRVLTKCDFIYQKSKSLFLKDNIRFNLIKLFSEKLELAYTTENLLITIVSIYRQKFERYLNN